MAPSKAEPERILQDAQAGRSFVAITRRDPDAPTTRRGVDSALQSFVEALRAPDASDLWPLPVSPMMDQKADQNDMSPGSPMHQMTQGMIASEADRIVLAKFRLSTHMLPRKP